MNELYTNYVEGAADVRFLSQYIHHLFGVVVLDERLVKLDGWTNLKGTAWQQRMRAITDNGGTNIVIIDAANDIEARRSDVLSWKAENALEFELFLLPNNQDAGALGESKSQKELIKEVNRNYENTQHWNLDAAYLEPLKEFLEANLN
jgi:hypothetical protein